MTDRMRDIMGGFASGIIIAVCLVSAAGGRVMPLPARIVGTVLLLVSLAVLVYVSWAFMRRERG